MVKNHLKRIATPKTWNILRKSQIFITRPNAGAHSLLLGTSLNTFIKEVVGEAKTKKEVKKILHDKKILVDGKIRHDERYNVGFMDVISLDKKYYRVVLDAKGKIAGVEIKGTEAKTKLSRIKNKVQIRGGKTLLTTSDGRSISIDKDSYKTGDSILISLPDQKIEGHFALAPGSHALILRGKHAGLMGNIEKIEEGKVLIKTKEGEILTKIDYAFVVGDKKAVVTCLS